MASAGDAIAGSRWGAAFGPAPTVPQSSTPVTDLSMHVGGMSAANNASVATAGEKQLMYWGAGIILAAVGLLWLLGGVVFSSARQ